MSKVAISFTIDAELVVIMESKSGNKSALVNAILREALLSKDSLNKEITNSEGHIKHLKKQLVQQQKEYQEGISNIPEGLSELINGTIKEIIQRNPTMLPKWADIVNKKFNKRYTEEQFRAILKKHSTKKNVIINNK